MVPAETNYRKEDLCGGWSNHLTRPPYITGGYGEVVATQPSQKGIGRMRILLIEPAKAPLTLGGEDVHIFEPLALEYIAAGVFSDHEVKLLDLRLHKGLEDILFSFRPEVVGITSYTVHVNGVKSLFKRIKQWNPEVLTVVGGHHATIAPEDFSTPFIDVIVLGEGVSTFREIVRRFQEGNAFDPIPGVAYREGERLIRTVSSMADDLDTLPFPERGLAPEDRKHYYAEWMKPLASIRTSKGCPYRCNFCALWKLTEGRYLKRDPEKIVEELSGIDEEFVFFADDESLVDAARMTRLAHLIEGAGIRKRYFLYGRSDTIRKNPDLLSLWKRIGLERVFVGLEFFRDEDLQYIRKGSRVDDNEQAIKTLHNLDLEVYASFIVRPEFSREDFRAFRRYCRDLRLRYATFAVLTPLPGTDLYDDVKEKMITHNYDLFDFLHTLLPTTLPLKEFYREYTDLIWNAVPPREGLAFLAKFPAREILPLLVKSARIRRRMRSAYKDYV